MNVGKFIESRNMGRLASIQKLHPDIRLKVDAILNANPHCTLDQLMALLEKNGLDVCSRSGLQRYLAGRDGMPHTPGNETIVTIVELKSGVVRVLRTPVSGALIEVAVTNLTDKFRVA